MFDPANPEKKHPCYARLEQLRQLPDDLLGGLPAILDRKAVYFPREIADGFPVTEKGITVDPYLNRMGRVTLFNMFKEGINDQLVGRVFARKVRWSEDTPAEIAGDPESKTIGFVDDVDGKATNAHVFLRRRFRNAVAKGLDGVLVEYPSTARVGERSIEDERRQGLRPYWRPYASSAVWDWDYRMIGGHETLVYLKLRDTWTDPESGEKVPALRIFTADRVNFVQVEVWAETKRGTGAAKPQYALVWSGLRTPHVEIPFVPIATDGDEPIEAEPELVDAAWLNLAHCRKPSAVDNSQHQINFPMLAISGITLEEAKAQIADGVGSHRAWIIPASRRRRHACRARRDVVGRRREHHRRDREARRPALAEAARTRELAAVDRAGRGERRVGPHVPTRSVGAGAHGFGEHAALFHGDRLGRGQARRRGRLGRGRFQRQLDEGAAGPRRGAARL